MTTQEILTYLNKRLSSAKYMRDAHLDDVRKACSHLDVKNATKYNEWLMQDYYLINELEIIIKEIESKETGVK